MGRGSGKKKGEYSVYDQDINNAKQWENLLMREVNHKLHNTLWIFLQ